MHRYCTECLRNLKPDEREEGICKLCKEELIEKRNLKRNKTEYNYERDHNPRDPWDNQSYYEEGYYEDESDW